MVLFDPAGDFAMFSPFVQFAVSKTSSQIILTIDDHVWALIMSNATYRSGERN
jgi:hypothetical protein